MATARRASRVLGTPALSRYMAQGFGRVEGQAGHEAVIHIDVLCRALPEIRGLGGACEIGVHHGQFFIALHNALEGAHPSLAIDIFEDQHLNVDLSGKGNRQRFDANVRRHAIYPERCHAHKADSLAISEDDITGFLARFGGFALFSVDGGHTAQHAANDLRIADRLTSEGGIVVVDDMFSAEWPGVTVGTADYLAAPGRRFRPFLLSRKKLYLTDDRCAAHYEAAFRDNARASVPGFWSKRTDFFGFPCLAAFSKLPW